MSPAFFQRAAVAWGCCRGAALVPTSALVRGAVSATKRSRSARLSAARAPSGGGEVVGEDDLGELGDGGFLAGLVEGSGDAEQLLQEGLYGVPVGGVEVGGEVEDDRAAGDDVGDGGGQGDEVDFWVVGGEGRFRQGLGQGLSGFGEFLV